MASTTRQRRERFINEHDGPFAGNFDPALFACMRAAGGLSFFTDEQIALITAEMVRRERRSQAIVIRNRRAIRAQRTGEAA